MQSKEFHASFFLSRSNADAHLMSHYNSIVYIFGCSGSLLLLLLFVVVVAKIVKFMKITEKKVNDFLNGYCYKFVYVWNSW